MAISQMAKMMIVSHRSEAAELLEALQSEGTCQILNAEEAMVSKDFPELAGISQRPRDLEELLNRLTKGIEFLKNYSQSKRSLVDALAPRKVVDQQAYSKVVSDADVLKIIEQCQQTEAAIEKLKNDSENLSNTLADLGPWAALETPVEEMGQLQQTTCLAGLLPAQYLERTEQQASELAAVIQPVGAVDNKEACLVACLNENLAEVQKLLRTADFEPVSFEGITGTVSESIARHSEELSRTKQQLQEQVDTASLLAEDLLKLEILHDHNTNLLSREQTRGTVPATEQTVILEGWVKQGDLRQLEKIVSKFAASSLSRIEPAENEEMPVEIENKNFIRPFEVITRLYGMPQHFDVDPTVFLAPFFALFFALCLTDAGYGLVIIGLMVFFIKKMQGDKKLMWMLGICSVATVVAGAMTGGWFGDAVQQFVPVLGPVREKMILFDPIENPMMFFVLSLALGYIQILTGLAIAFIHNLKRKDYIAAVCDQLTWLVMLNSIVLFAMGKTGIIPAHTGRLFGTLALFPAAMILLFSQRQGNWGARLGIGFYNLFSAIFYMGDVLSYLRLMALGMVTAGLAMAINVIAKIALDLPYGTGVVLMILILIGCHSFNMAINALGAFVHTLRLQYAEFFPKFFVGGGRLFEPLSKEYKHICIVKRKA